MLVNLRHVPRPPLARFIENLWLIRGNLSSRWRNFIFPDGAMELIINLGDPQKLCDSGNPRSHTYYKRSWISGERFKPILIEETGKIDLVGVRFKPGGAYPFFRFPISELTGQVLEMDAIWGDAIEELREKLTGASDHRAVFARLESWLMERMSPQVNGSHRIEFALQQIRRGGEYARIGSIADAAGISHKHLVREFERHVGLSPKLFARVCAFQNAIAWVGFKETVDWADAAIACGYYDQAHFIHEFRAFSGMTPAAYLHRRGPYLNYVSPE